MSRSNPTEGSNNPAARWFEWAGGSDGGHLRYYDKGSKQNIVVPLPFTFLLLDNLSTVKGWHDPSQGGIYANEVRDTRSEVLVVRAFKAGELASGIYSDIREKVRAAGGHYCASLYIAWKDGAELKIGNLMLKGAAAGVWMDFKKISSKRINVDAIVLGGYEDQKKGATLYRTPVFKLKEVAEETNAAAIKLDGELQAFLDGYLKRPKEDAATEPPFHPEEHEPLDEEIPF